MYEHIVEAFEKLKGEVEITKQWSKAADEFQARADLEKIKARNRYNVAVAQFVEAASAPVGLMDKTYIPSIEKVNSEIAIVGVGEDNLVVIDPSGVHYYGPAVDGQWRHCAECGRPLSYPVVNLAPKGSVKDAEAIVNG